MTRKSENHLYHQIYLLSGIFLGIRFILMETSIIISHLGMVVNLWVFLWPVL